MITSCRVVTLQTLTIAITLINPWKSNYVFVQALCPLHQTVPNNSPRITTARFHGLRNGYHPHCCLYSTTHANTEQRILRVPSHNHTPPTTTTTTTTQGRKPFLQTLSRCLFTLALLPPTAPATAATTNTKDSKASLLNSLSQIKQARSQIEAVPPLITAEKWDSVRQILATPPLSDCWMKTGRPLLQDYTNALGDNPDSTTSDDAEFEALELKEEALDHLRFLDMSVYNNVFNPIKTEGETGATKELIKSYYEDPGKEYKASLDALDGLLKLVKE